VEQRSNLLDSVGVFFFKVLCFYPLGLGLPCESGPSSAGFGRDKIDALRPLRLALWLANSCLVRAKSSPSYQKVKESSYYDPAFEFGLRGTIISTATKTHWIPTGHHMHPTSVFPSDPPSSDSRQAN
jgi:hypothetical protein